MRFVVVCVAAVGAVVAGCATITRGTTSQVEITSDPPQAEARTSMGHTCVTPCTLQFGRRDEFVVTITKAGYHPEEVKVTTQVAGAGVAGLAGNAVLGGVIGAGVDVASGATLEHCPNPVSVVLQSRSRPRRPTPPPSCKATVDPNDLPQSSTY
jgi:hypothetical protein